MANERRSHKIVLFCCKAHRKWLVDRRSSGKFIVKTGLIKATPSTLDSEGKPDHSELSTNHSSSGLHWDCRRPSLIRWPKSQAFLTVLLAEKNQTNRETNKQINKQTKKQRKKKIMIAIMNPHSAVGVSCRRNACYRSLFCILITASIVPTWLKFIAIQKCLCYNSSKGLSKSQEFSKAMIEVSPDRLFYFLLL